jgi:hypothetical protein
MSVFDRDEEPAAAVAHSWVSVELESVAGEAPVPLNVTARRRRAADFRY